MTCPQCGRDNPVSQLYCSGCGQQLDLSREQVQASVQKELKNERLRNLESIVRAAVCFAIVFKIVVTFLEGLTQVLPEPDLVPIIQMDAMSVEKPGLISFEEEGIQPLPSIELSDYVPPDSHKVKVSVNSLQEQVYSIDNVILFLKVPANARRPGRLLGEDDEFYYLMETITKSENKVPKENVKEIKRLEGAR